MWDWMSLKRRKMSRKGLRMWIEVIIFTFNIPIFYEP